MPKIMPDWSKLRETTWPVDGTYEAVILSNDEYAEEVQVGGEDGDWELRFKLLVYKCRDREDGLIALEDGREVEEHEVEVRLPTSGVFVWKLHRFLRMLGYPNGGRVEEFDTNDFHGVRVIVKITKGVSKKTGREFHDIDWLGRLRKEEEGRGAA